MNRTNKFKWCHSFNEARANIHDDQRCERPSILNLRYCFEERQLAKDVISAKHIIREMLEFRKFGAKLIDRTAPTETVR